MKTLSLLTLLLVGLCSTAIAADSDLEKSLTSKYKDQVLILRHPIDSNSQRYNSGGELLSRGKEGPWTVNAAIEINEIHVTQDKLIIDGKRRVYGFDSRQNRLLPVKVKERDKPRVTLEISLDSPLVSVEQVETILHRIFVNNAGELTGFGSRVLALFSCKAIRRAQSRRFSDSCGGFWRIQFCCQG